MCSTPFSWNLTFFSFAFYFSLPLPFLPLSLNLPLPLPLSFYFLCLLSSCVTHRLSTSTSRGVSYSRSVKTASRMSGGSASGILNDASLPRCDSTLDTIQYKYMYTVSSQVRLDSRHYSV